MLNKYCYIVAGCGSVLLSIALFWLSYFLYFVVSGESGVGLPIFTALIGFTFAGAGLTLCLGMIKDLRCEKRKKHHFNEIRPTGPLVMGDSIWHQF